MTNPCEFREFCGKRMCYGDRRNGCSARDSYHCSQALKLEDRVMEEHVERADRHFPLNLHKYVRAT